MALHLLDEKEVGKRSLFASQAQSQRTVCIAQGMGLRLPGKEGHEQLQWFVEK